MTTIARRRIPQLVDFDRVREALNRFALDAVVCSLPHNVHYLSGLDAPPLWHFPTYAFAIVPAKGDPALVLSGLQLSTLAEMELWIEDVYPFSRGENIVYDAGSLLEAEQFIRDLKHELRGKTSGTPFEAVVRALRDRGLMNARLGFDDPGVIAKLPAEDLNSFDAVDVMRAIRMVKTEAEIQRMRDAATDNEDSALEAIRLIPTAKTIEEIILHFRAALALRGGEARYLLVGAPHKTGSFQHQFQDYPPRRGEFFMMDALGAKKHYHGDFGRTASWGEPDPKVRKRFDAMREGFLAGLEKARPGVLLDDVRQAVVDAVHKQGFSQFMACTPHSVGMEHTDMPRVSGQTVRANMTMNIDIVYMEAGFGALHLEDTFLVRQNGAELLTSGQTEMLVLK